MTYEAAPDALLPRIGCLHDFSNQHVPAMVVGLLFRREIHVADLLLLFAIGDVVDRNRSETNRGCSANDAYLAEAANILLHSVPKRIERLKRQGIVIEVRMDGTRYLELEWSRIGIELNAMEGKYGRLLRKAHEGSYEGLRSLLTT